MSVVVDASDRDLRTVSDQIKAGVTDGSVVVRNASHLHGLAAGLSSGEITIEGESGDYLGVLNNGARITVEGDAGLYLGDNMTSGEVIVNGDAGYGVGQYCYGGTILVRGNTGDFTAVMNKGATIIIEGNVGNEVATYMLAGDLIILGNAGRNLGNYLIRGEIYIRGEVQSLGHNTLVEGMTEADIEKLERHFDRYQIDAPADQFRKIVRLTEKPFYGAKETQVKQVGLECITN